MSHYLITSPWLNTLISSWQAVQCARTLYGLRTLRAHGMPQACLQIVFRSSALAKLLYASPAWWGFADASEKNRLEAFLRRAGKSGYYTDDSLPNVAALCEQANGQLFRSIKYKPTHPLWPLLPPKRSTPYCTRPSPHNNKLPSKINNIDECNFMYRTCIVQRLL